MNAYIDAINRSRTDSNMESLAAVKIDLSSLSGSDWIDVMDDSAAVWQKEYLTDAVLKLFADSIWEIDGRFLGADCLLDDCGQPESHCFIEIFDQYVRTCTAQRRLNLERLVQLAGESVLDRQVAA